MSARPVACDETGRGGLAGARAGAQDGCVDVCYVLFMADEMTATPRTMKYGTRATAVTAALFPDAWRSRSTCRVVLVLAAVHRSSVVFVSQ